MSDSTHAQRIVTPPKGSWEEKLIEGLKLLAKQEDSGRVLLQNLIERLFQMPETMRLAGNQRLNTILLTALLFLARDLAYRDQIDEAAALFERAETVERPERRTRWRFYRARVLLLNEPRDEGFELLQALAASEANVKKRLELWETYLNRAFYWHQLDRIEQTIVELERAANRASATSGDETEARLLQSVRAYFQARVCLAQDRIDEAQHWMDYALAQQSLPSDYIYDFVFELIGRGEYTKALKWVQRDQENIEFVKFLSGYIHFHLGDRSEAERLWRQVIRIFLDADESEEIDLVATALSDYYLGSKERLGLSILLQSMQEKEKEEITSREFLLTGLGWAMLGEKLSAHSNFKLALMRFKFLGISPKLEWHWWLFCKDLIPATDLPEYEGYFAISSTSSGSMS
jgi:tetratricopeptide (TPR) repeat protein